MCVILNLPNRSFFTAKLDDLSGTVVIAKNLVSSEVMANDVEIVQFLYHRHELVVRFVFLHFVQQLIHRIFRSTGNGDEFGHSRAHRLEDLWFWIALQKHVGVRTAEPERVYGYQTAIKGCRLVYNLKQISQLQFFSKRSPEKKKIKYQKKGL